MKYLTKALSLPNGTRKYIRGKTKEELERKVLAAQVELRAGINIKDNTTVAQLAQLWFDIFKKDNLKPRSVDTIRDTLNRYIIPQIGGKEVRKIKPSQILALMQSVSTKSKSIQTKVLQFTRAIFQFAVDSDIILKTPVISTIQAKGAPPKIEDPLTPAQTMQLLQNTEGTRAHLFCLILLYTGLRKGEALGLRWEDVDFKDGILRVRRSIVYPKGGKYGVINEDMKTAAARRDIPLVPIALVALAEAKAKSKSEYIFAMKNGAHLTEYSSRGLWKLAEDRVDFKVHPHLLRHTCITRWFEAGLDLKEIQYLAGHSSVNITLDIYTHYDRKSRADETAEKIRAMQVYA